MYLTVNQTASLNEIAVMQDNPMYDIYMLGAMIIGIYSMEYTKDCFTVYERVNYNIHGWKTNIPFVESVTIVQVERVINAYQNIILGNPQIEQWYPPDFKEKGQQSLFGLIQKASGVSAQYTKMIMDELYWAVKDGKIANVNWIRPREFEEYKEYRKQNTNTEGHKILETSFDWIKWLLIIGSVGVGAYLLFNLIQTGKAIGK
ncbi:MAG TPA: hypothetical protein PLE30_09830 [Candidatus Kapabacteria bacterium]|nr:hypothetical protein [Candidatus Kapabacteria bacterium]